MSLLDTVRTIAVAALCTTLLTAAPAQSQGACVVVSSGPAQGQSWAEPPAGNSGAQRVFTSRQSEVALRRGRIADQRLWQGLGG